MKFTHIFLAVFGLLLAFAMISGEPAAAEVVSTAGIGTFMAGDFLLRKSKALPSGASAVTCDPIDLGHDPTKGGRNVIQSEFELKAPDLATALLPNGQTITYAVVTSASSDMSSPEVVQDAIKVQTGAGGEGDAGSTVQFRLPTTCQRFVAVRATKVGSADASAALFTIALKQ